MFERKKEGRKEEWKKRREEKEQERPLEQRKKRPQYARDLDFNLSRSPNYSYLWNPIPTHGQTLLTYEI